MRIAIMGAGAVGCHLGGRLAQAGHDVTLVGRPRLLKALEQDGLRLESTARGTDDRVRVRATTDPAAVREADAVLVCVKSLATEEAGTQIAPHLRPGALVVSVQNGLDNAEVLRTAIGRDDVTVYPSVIYVAVGMAGAAHVRHVGGGRVLLPDSASSALVTALRDAVEVETVSDVVPAQWTKFVVNCAWNALSALTGLSYARLNDSPHIPAVLEQIVGECDAVARAEGVTLDDPLGATLALVAVMPDQLSSTAQDLAAGRRTEIDQLNGHVVRRGAELGIPTPANELLLALTRIAEETRPH
ncbi:ketopantoate reductase family protein [Mobilicoccus massiliensis]|uniref:ketopantoate reductase family protein n=1 Tax=Mobilicoccus massiliensis TaxID=1522310 RepID=UPI00058B2391|nr:2-dehydropantoate 2-reductase [Mobilicoccus massiliensis]